MKKKDITTISLIIILVVIFASRLDLIVSRYFDADEFAHLHWAYLLFTGHIPYRDFFMNTTPIYQLFNLPIFIFKWSGFTLILARLWQVSYYFGLLIILFLIAHKITKNIKASMLTLIIFIGFPMIFIKSFEIRPDMLMTFIYMLGLWTYLVALKKPEIPQKQIFWGSFYIGLSILTMAKMIVGLPVIFWFWIYDKRLRQKNIFAAIISGLLLPVCIFTIYLIITNSLALSWEHIIDGSRYIKAGEGAFSPLKSLSPWPFVYVEAGGPSIPWYVNAFLWILAVPGLFFMFLKNRFMAVTLLVFVLGNILGLFIFPTPYMQYFIPVAAIFSVCVAYLIYICNKFPKVRKFSNILYLFIGVIVSFSVYTQYKYLKPLNINEQTQVVDDILKISKPNETFYDMVGSYLLRPDGYFICCNIYSHIFNFLGNSPGYLKDSLLKNNTKFIVMDRVGKSFWHPLPIDLEFMKLNYQPSIYRKIYVLGVKFRCESYCIRLDAFDREIPSYSTSSFEIKIPEKYYLTTLPGGQRVNIDGIDRLDGESFKLEAGMYRFEVGTSVAEFSVRMFR